MEQVSRDLYEQKIAASKKQNDDIDSPGLIDTGGASLSELLSDMEGEDADIEEINMHQLEKVFASQSKNKRSTITGSYRKSSLVKHKRIKSRLNLDK